MVRITRTHSKCYIITNQQYLKKQLNYENNFWWKLYVHQSIPYPQVKSFGYACYNHSKFLNKLFFPNGCLPTFYEQKKIHSFIAQLILDKLLTHDFGFGAPWVYPGKFDHNHLKILDAALLMSTLIFKISQFKEPCTLIGENHFWAYPGTVNHAH